MAYFLVHYHFVHSCSNYRYLIDKAVQAAVKEAREEAREEVAQVLRKEPQTTRKGEP